MTDSLLPSPKTLITPPEVPVPETGEFEVDVHTVLQAIVHDSRNRDEKDLATTQLKIWHAIKDLLVPDTADEVGGRMLDICFPGWEKCGLVQLAAAFGSAIAGEVNRSASMDRPVKMLVVGGETAVRE